ncbi:MAG: hypothetical protein WAP74_01285, partial [Patescibacteria group bacterium]
DITTGTNEALTVTANGTGDIVFAVDSGTLIGVGGATPAGVFHIDGEFDDEQLIVEANATQTAQIVEVRNSSGTVLAAFDESGAAVYGLSTLTIADDTVALSAPTGTLTPTTSYAEVTCNDADGCNLALSETGAREGQVVIVANVSAANTLTLTDSAGVFETDSSALSAFGAANIIYIGDRWVVTGRSVN